MYYEDLNEVFRSAWEANIVRLLNLLYINWKYGKKISFLIVNSLLKNMDIIHILLIFLVTIEISRLKVIWDVHSLEQVSLFKEQYLEYSLYIIDSDMLYSLNKMYKASNWKSIFVTTSAETIPIVGITIKERVQNSKTL